MKQQRTSHALKGVFVLVAMIAALLIATAATADRRGGPDLRPQEPQTDVSKAPKAALPQGAQLVDEQAFDALPPGWTVAQTTLLPDQVPAWAVEGGVLAQDMTAGAGAGFTPAIFLGPRTVPGDSVISAQVYPQGNQVVGLVFRSNAAGYYLFTVFRETQDAPIMGQLLRYDAGTGLYTKLAETAEGAGFALGRWQELRVELEGDVITALFDGRPVFKVQDATYTAGQVGVYTIALGEVLFDNVTIAKRK